MPAATAKSTAPAVEATVTATQSPDLTVDPVAKAKTTKASAAGSTKAKTAVKTTKAKTTKAKAATAEAKSGVKTTKAKTTKAKAATTEAKSGVKTTKAKTTKAKAATTEAKSGVKTTKAKTTKAKPAEEAAPTAAATPAVAVTTTVSKDGKAAKLPSIKIGPKGVYTEDSIRVYLQEIGRIRLLRPDEEIELARKIADLLHLEEIADQFEEDNGKYPDNREWATLVDMPPIKFRRRLMLGRRAKEKMVQSNLRLVVSIAKKYMNRGLSFQDLIQEGSLGLIRAAEKFDHEKGYKFSTYATWWIRQAITRAIADQSRTIRLPVHLYETISRIKKTTKVLSQEFGRKPTEEEIAESMEMTIEKLRFIAKSAQLPISLETPIGKEEDSRLGDFIEADIENPDQDVAKNLLREDLEGVLATLSPRERDVLRLRYGLDDGRMKTLEEIGQIFDVTRERIRQIEAKALRKLRHPNRNGVLKEYIK